MPYRNGCRDCGETTDGSTRCAACREKRRAATAEARAARRAQGLCLACGEPVAKTKTAGGALRVRRPSVYCKAHLAYYAARQRSRSAP